MGHHTKDKGDLAVLKVATDLCEQGFTVCTPLTEHAPFDLVVYQDGIFSKVQVKFCTASKGRICISTITSWSDKKGIHRSSYQKEDFDVMAAYCPDTKLCYYLGWSDIQSRATSLRIYPAKNNQRMNVRIAQDYTKFPRP